MAISTEEYNEVTDAFTAIKEACEQRIAKIRKEVRAPLVAQAEKEFDKITDSEARSIQ